jgi:hypothetical protein
MAPAVVGGPSLIFSPIGGPGLEGNASPGERTPIICGLAFPIERNIFIACR